MKPSAPQITLMTWLGLTAWVAVTIWLFRQSALWGIIGLSVFKHVAIAQLCQALGVDRRPGPPDAIAGRGESNTAPGSRQGDAQGHKRVAPTGRVVGKMLC